MSIINGSIIFIFRFYQTGFILMLSNKFIKERSSSFSDTSTRYGVQDLITIIQNLVLAMFLRAHFSHLDFIALDNFKLPLDLFEFLAFGMFGSGLGTPIHIVYCSFNITFYIAVLRLICHVFTFIERLYLGNVGFALLYPLV